MIKYLTVDSVINLHSVVKTHFRDNTTIGQIDRHKIESIINKPKIEIAGQEVYPTIYEKAACILEAFCREHIFADGNKRTAILAMVTFLAINNYNIALPLSTVKYTVKITRQLEQDSENIEDLIKKISKWIEQRSSADDKNHKKKFRRYVSLPVITILVLAWSIVGIPIGYFLVRDWLQLKMHPEYNDKLRLAIRFIWIIIPNFGRNIKQ